MIRALALLGCIVPLPPLRAFELRCFQGTGEEQPAGGSSLGVDADRPPPPGSGEPSTGERAMTFPNDAIERPEPWAQQHQWTQVWLDGFLSAHPELETKDPLTLSGTGEYADLDKANPNHFQSLVHPDLQIEFDFDAGQPPDEERFKELIVSGTGMPASAVTVESYRQRVSFRLRLPGTTAEYATVVGKVAGGTSCTPGEDLCDSAPCDCKNLDPDRVLDDRSCLTEASATVPACLSTDHDWEPPLSAVWVAVDPFTCGDTPEEQDADACNCRSQAAQDGAICQPVPVWDCSGAPGCAAHTALRLLKAPPDPQSLTREADTMRYNTFMNVRTNDFCRDFAHLNPQSSGDRRRAYCREEPLPDYEGGDSPMLERGYDRLLPGRRSHTDRGV